MILASTTSMEGRSVAERRADSIAESVIGTGTSRDVCASTRDVVGSRSSGRWKGLADTCKQAIEHAGARQAMEVAR